MHWAQSLQKGHWLCTLKSHQNSKRLVRLAANSPRCHWPWLHFRGQAFPRKFSAGRLSWGFRKKETSHLHMSPSLLIYKDRKRWSGLWFEEITSVASRLNSGSAQLTYHQTGHKPQPSRMQLSPQLHLNPPGNSSPSSEWAGSRSPLSFHTSYRQKYSVKALKPKPGREISVNCAKMSFLNTDLRSTGLPCVNRTPCPPLARWALVVAPKPGSSVPGIWENLPQEKAHKKHLARVKITSQRYPLEKPMLRFQLTEISSLAHCSYSPSPAPPLLCRSPLPRSLGHPSTWLTRWQQLPAQKVGQMNTHSL